VDNNKSIGGNNDKISVVHVGTYNKVGNDDKTLVVHVGIYGKIGMGITPKL
jgi:hypothetical protein